MAVTMKRLSDLISTEYKSYGLKTKIINTTIINPLIKLSTIQEDMLNEGDGQSYNQYLQINSSTGLAVNYYKLLEEQKNIKQLVFEDKVARPLNKGGKCANIDVSFIRDNKLYFVESKYLEPYYSGNEVINDSYLDSNRYPKEIPSSDYSNWKKLFRWTKDFKLYNVTQLCRHLLAIYRFTHGHSDAYYNGQQVVLQSVIWKMTDMFLSLCDDSTKKDLERKILILEKEKNACDLYINEFIESINWQNMVFESHYYNDILCDIKESDFYDEFCKRYFFPMNKS